MSGVKNKTMSLYEKNNTDLRKKILGNTMLQSQFEVQKQSPFKRPTVDLLRESKTSQVKQTSDRNMKFKLDQLQSSLQQFLSELRNVRQQNRQLVQYATLLKQNLVYEDLYARKAELDQKIQGFSNHIRAIKTSCQNRYDQIYGECAQLWKRTEELRQNVFNIRIRVEELEQKMGFKEMYRMNSL